MDRVTFRFSFSELNISVPQIGKVLDYDKGEDREMIAGMIEEAIGEAEKLCDIRAEYVICRDVVTYHESGNLLVNGIEFNVGKIVRGQLRKAQAVAVFLCTAGPVIGEHARRLIAEKDFLKGYIFDVAGSEIVEAAADLMQNELRAKMEGLNNLITNRYSPGYCGWHVSEQQKLFRLIPDNFCGIKLHPSSLMDPIKSVSGFIGIGEKVRYNPYTCNACEMDNCIYRKLKSNSY